MRQSVCSPSKKRMDEGIFEQRLSFAMDWWIRGCVLPPKRGGMRRYWSKGSLLLWIGGLEGVFSLQKEEE